MGLATSREQQILRDAQDDKSEAGAEAIELQVSPLRFAPVEMTIS